MTEQRQAILFAVMGFVFLCIGFGLGIAVAGILMEMK